MMQHPASLPDDLRRFTDSVQWHFAKTMPEWPHEYIVRGKVDESLFVQLVKYIREHGYQGRFYRMSITYLDDRGLTYWTMGAPVEETTIINRCTKEQTYEARLRRGALPGSKNPGNEQEGTHEAR